jgi:two-component system NarL family sensor kinase
VTEPLTGPRTSPAWDNLLRQIVELSTVERDLRTALRRVAELVVAATGADCCFVHLVDHERRELVLMGATPEAFDQLAGSIRLSLGEGVSGWVAAHAQSTLVPDKWSDPRYRYIPALRGEDFSSLASVPLLRPPRTVVGVLNIHARQVGHFSEEDLPRLEEVAGLLAGIVENAVLYDQLRRREAELARFVARTVELQELERRRVAAELHDGVSQRLVSALYHLEAAQDSGQPPASRSLLHTAEQLLRDALSDTRAAIGGLRPPVLDDLGLAPALESLARSLGGDFDVVLHLEPLRAPGHLETALYRVAQEALQNVVKHAQASLVRLELHQDASGIQLTVADDGQGFDLEASRAPVHYGLRSIAERVELVGGTLTLESTPGRGTTLRVNLPVATVDEGDSRRAGGLSPPGGPLAGSPGARSGPREADLPATP